ncbi:hypothetical protein PV364_40295 [Streptomyces sp. MI02-7b]|nr:hypothetical protein [Streptomyces sp. MI02-7b]MDX3078515.1 hypothetical protein [Streptomyces sp. MI02-7b]
MGDRLVQVGQLAADERAGLGVHALLEVVDGRLKLRCAGNHVRGPVLLDQPVVP